MDTHVDTTAVPLRSRPSVNRLPAAERAARLAHPAFGPARRSGGVRGPEGVPDGGVAIFRPDAHARRLRDSARRLRACRNGGQSRLLTLADDLGMEPIEAPLSAVRRARSPTAGGWLRPVA